MGGTAEPDALEFLFDVLRPTEMCAADDLFLRGRLLPLHRAFPKPQPPHHPLPPPDIAVTYTKLRRSGSPQPPRTRRPSWSLLAFGLVRAPAAAVGKMRSRRRRTSPATEPEWEAAGWKILHSLSCRAVAAAATLGPDPHARGA